MKICVTGGGGFLGQAIVRQLLAAGHQVVSYSRGRYPQLERLGCEQRPGDLNEPQRLAAALRDCEAVIHTAARAGVWGRYTDFHTVNVRGTEHVISACQQAGITRLVYTSSPSVVHDGNGLEGADESTPYAHHFEAYYPQTKALAEKMVLQANGPQLATVALRPHLIWGPGDPHFAPRLIARARAGRLRLVGDQDFKVDTVYIDNAAEAHLLALERLQPGAPLAGNAYFITQDQPETAAQFINRLIGAAGLPPVERRIPARLAYVMGAGLESVYRALSLPGEPPMTRFMARQLSTPHWFDISAARRDLGYTPRISTDQGMAHFKDWLAQHPL